MRWRTVLRIAPGAWLTPAMLGVVVLYVSQSITFAHREPYSLGLTARAMNVLGLVVPVFAAAATWEGGRLSQSGTWALPIVRHRLAVAICLIAPSLVGGTLVIIVAVMQVQLHEGLFAPDPLVVLVAIALLASHAFAGFAAGLLLPRVMALPLVALGSLAWFVLPRVFRPTWLLHPFGTSLELCCQVDEVLAPQVVAGILLVSAGVAGAASVLIMRGPATRRALVGVAVQAAALFIVAALVVRPIPMSPTIARTDVSQVCRAGTTATVCLWPEHSSQVSTVADIADKVVSMWAAYGIAPPTAFVEGPTTDHPGAVSVAVVSGISDWEIIMELARALLPSAPACATTEPWPSAIAGQYLWVWLATVAGVPPGEIRYYEGDERPERERFPDTPRQQFVPVRPLVDRIVTLSAERQRQWATANLQAMAECGIEAPLDPR